MLPEQSNTSLEHNAGENRSEEWLRIWLVETEMLPEQSNTSLEHNAGENRSEEWLRIFQKYLARRDGECFRNRAIFLYNTTPGKIAVKKACA